MLQDLSKFGVVVLAAGRGTRLGCVDEPKVMRKIGDRPIVGYIVETLQNIGFTKEQICLMIGFCGEKVREYFGDKVMYAEQVEQKGTAHAAYTGSVTLPKQCKHILVINGDDSAFYSTTTVENLMTTHLNGQAVATLLSVVLPEIGNYGRIARDGDGRIEIIEKEYLSEATYPIRETSTGTFCFDRAWFEKIFPVMPPLRKLGEYGLPTTFSVAQNEGAYLQVVILGNIDEWFGVNTPEELAEADRRKKI